MSLRSDVLLACACVTATVLAQQPNSSNGSMIWDGVNGPPWPIAVTVFAAPNPMTLTLSGVPNQGYALVHAPGGIATPGFQWTAGIVDLNLSGGVIFLMDGISFSTGSLLDYLANTGPIGTSAWSVPVSPAAAGFAGAFQALGDASCESHP